MRGEGTWKTFPLKVPQSAPGEVYKRYLLPAQRRQTQANLNRNTLHRRVATTFREASATSDGAVSFVES